jgi:hypothetical protein
VREEDLIEHIDGNCRVCYVWICKRKILLSTLMSSYDQGGLAV